MTYEGSNANIIRQNDSSNSFIINDALEEQYLLDFYEKMHEWYPDGGIMKLDRARVRNWEKERTNVNNGMPIQNSSERQQAAAVERPHIQTSASAAQASQAERKQAPVEKPSTPAERPPPVALPPRAPVEWKSSETNPSPTTTTQLPVGSDSITPTSATSSHKSPPPQTSPKQGKRTRILFTAEEDQILLETVQKLQKHGKIKWSQVKKELGSSRTVPSLQQRYNLYLDPELNRGPWSEEESREVWELFKVHGEKFTQIANEMKTSKRSYLMVKSQIKNLKEFPPKELDSTTPVSKPSPQKQIEAKHDVRPVSPKKVTTAPQKEFQKRKRLFTNDEGSDSEEDEGTSTKPDAQGSSPSSKIATKRAEPPTDSLDVFFYSSDESVSSRSPKRKSSVAQPPKKVRRISPEQTVTVETMRPPKVQTELLPQQAKEPAKIEAAKSTAQRSATNIEAKSLPTQQKEPAKTAKLPQIHPQITKSHTVSHKDTLLHVVPPPLQPEVAPRSVPIIRLRVIPKKRVHCGQFSTHHIAEPKDLKRKRPEEDHHRGMSTSFPQGNTRKTVKLLVAGNKKKKRRVYIVDWDD